MGATRYNIIRAVIYTYDDLLRNIKRKKRAHGKMAFAGIMLVAACLLSFFPAYGGTITESFSNNQYNNQWWWIHSFAQGVTANVANNHLEISLPETASPGADYMGFISLIAETALLGDFDMQADFTLLNWPAQNQAQIVLGIGAGLFQVNRRSRGVNEGDGSEVYYTYVLGQVTGSSQPASGTAGKLRMKRTGNTVQGFYWDGASWQLVGSSTDVNLGVPTGIFIGLDRNNQSYGPAVQIAIDNIQLTYATLGQYITENFDNNTYNQDLFFLHESQGVASTIVANNQLEVTIPANDGTFYSVGGMQNQFNLVGDFDIQVDFGLPTWPAAAGVNAGIITPNFDVARVSLYDPEKGNVDAYKAFFRPGMTYYWVDTSDRTGKLRLKRTGNTVEAFYWNGGGWTSIGSHTDSQLGAPVSGYIGAWSGANTQSKTVQAVFDNYQIVYDKISSGNHSSAMGGILQLLLY